MKDDPVATIIPSGASLQARPASLAAKEQIRHPTCKRHAHEQIRNQRPRALAQDQLQDVSLPCPSAMRMPTSRIRNIICEPPLGVDRLIRRARDSQKAAWKDRGGTAPT